jgi:PAS domain S-box-containing protein
MVEKPGSNKKGEHKSAREKFLSLSLESTRKSYYPQLQKQLEVAKELAEKYRQIVEYAPAGIYEFDMEKMRFISVNDVMCEYTGYTKKEFLELDPSLLFAEESQKKFKELLNEVFAGNQNPEPVEYKIIGKNNRELWVLVNTRFFFENGLPFKATAVVHDLTTIRKAEEEKNRLEAQLQQAQKMEAERLERMVEERTHELEAAQEELVKHEKLSVLGQLTATVSHEQ